MNRQPSGQPLWMWAWDDRYYSHDYYYDDDMPPVDFDEQRRWHICAVDGGHISKVSSTILTSLCGLTYDAWYSAFAPSFSVWLMRRQWFRRSHVILEGKVLGPLVVCETCVGAWNSKNFVTTPF